MNTEGLCYPGLNGPYTCGENRKLFWRIDDVVYYEEDLKDWPPQLLFRVYCMEKEV